MNQSWTDEIEKKYRLAGQEAAQALLKNALRHGLQETSWSLQRDWVPDFAGGLMRDKGVLLRIRTFDYLQGDGPTWLMTLKIKNSSNGIHHNKELEASSIDTRNVPEIAQFIRQTFNVTVDPIILASLDHSYSC